MTILKSLLLSKTLRTLLGLLIGSISIWLALRKVSLQEVAQILTGADVWLIGLALTSVAANILAKALRWRVILGRSGKIMPFKPQLLSLMAGQALNLIYPARLGDLSRAYVIGGMGAGRAFVLGTVVLEKIFDLLAYSMLFLFVLFFIQLPAWVNNSSYLLVLITLLAASLILVVAYRLESVVRLVQMLSNRLPERLRTVVEGRVESGLASLQVLTSRTELLKLALWTLFVWGTAILNNYLLLLALKLDAPPVAAPLLLIVLQASVSVPNVIPAGLGVYEYLCILTLSLFGVEQSPALGFAILLHTITLLLPTLFGLFAAGLLGKEGSRAHLLAHLQRDDR